MAVDEKTNPIKRHDAIVNFSREHHYVLLLCWKIREGIKRKVAPSRIAAYISFFFENNLQQHFHEEETVLFSRLPGNDKLILQALEDHKKIMDIIGSVKVNADINLIIGLADALDAHTRFEERKLFNHIQNKLTDKELLNLSKTHQHRAHDIDGRWNDQFWK